MDEKKYPQIGPTGSGSSLEDKVNAEYLEARKAGAEASAVLAMLSIKQKYEKLKAQSQTRETENFERVGDFVYGKSFQMAFAVSAVVSFYGVAGNVTIRLGGGADMHGAGTVEELLEILQ